MTYQYHIGQLCLSSSRVTTNGHKGTFLGWWNVLYDDCGGSYTICENSSHCILKFGELYSI